MYTHNRKQKTKERLKRLRKQHLKLEIKRTYYLLEIEENVYLLALLGQNPLQGSVTVTPLSV